VRVVSLGHTREPWHRSGVGSRVRAASSSRRGGGGGAGAGRVGPKSDVHKGGGGGPEAAGAGGGGGSEAPALFLLVHPHATVAVALHPTVEPQGPRARSPRWGSRGQAPPPAHPLRVGLLLRAPSPSRSPSSSSPLSLSSLPRAGAGLDLEAGKLLWARRQRNKDQGGGPATMCWWPATLAAFPLLAGGNCPCGCAKVAAVLLEATCF
jgi:hypothetical protein